MEARSAGTPVDTWVFDLDDTLYPASVGLHGRMKQRVVAFIAEALGVPDQRAEAIHLDYYERFGSTLQAMVELHGVPPMRFLDFVHEIELAGLDPDPRLAAALAALPGRRVVFTNSSARHAETILGVLGIADLFEGVCHIEHCGYVGKPQRSAYDYFFAAHGIDPARAAMFEDRPGNLAVSHERGMRTVLILPAEGDAAAARGALPGHVHAATADLPHFLAGLPGEGFRIGR